MPIQDPTVQQNLIQIAETAARRQVLLEKCRSIEKSDFRCTINGVERLRAYRRELVEIELELESAVKTWTDSFDKTTRSAI